MKEATYTPRPGSKVEAAAQALRDGPMTAKDLAEAIGSEIKNLHAMLSASIEHGVIVRVKDQTGLPHYALGGTVLDERFDAYAGHLGVRALVRSVKSPSVSASPEALAAANPFRSRVAVAHKAGAEHEPVKPKEKSLMEKLLHARAVSQEKRLVAGLFNNGELMISTGAESIRLNQGQTRELFDYLDKITGLIGENEKSPH